MTSVYRPIENGEIPALKEYIHRLYAEDPGKVPMNPDKMNRTIAYLQSHPQNGVILAFIVDSVFAGYAILINFWSNDWGGIIVHIDELYVDKAFRNRQVASDFIRYLIETRYNDCKAIMLEVRPDNHHAHRLYSRLGFKAVENQPMRIVFG